MLTFTPITPELVGTMSLGGDAQISALQNALKALAQTGLPSCNPGAETGTITDQTIMAVAAAMPYIPVGDVLKGQIDGLVNQAKAAFADWLQDTMCEDVSSLFCGAEDEAKADLVGLIQGNAPLLTEAVKSATNSRMTTGGRALLPAGKPSVATRFDPRIATTAEEVGVKPGWVRTLAPSEGAVPWYRNWKVLLPVGVGVAAAGFGAWWFFVKK